MTELDALRHDNDELRSRVELLQQRASDVESGASPSPLLRAIFESATDAIMLADNDGVYLDANPAACRLFGLGREQLLGRGIADFMPPGHYDSSGFAEFLSLGQMSGQFPIRRSDGTIATLEYTAVANVVPGKHLSVLRDITGRVAVEGALRESRGQLEEAQAIAHVGSWRSGVKGLDHIEWSRECYVIFGVPENTPITVASFFALVHPGDRERVEQASHDAYARDAPYDIEHRVLRPDGRPCWVHERAVVERDAAGNPIWMMGTVQDVTDRTATLMALRASEERYRRIVENTSEGVWLYDANAVTTFMNTRMAELLGYSVDEAIGLPVFSFMDESQRATAEAKVDRRHRGIAERYDFRLRHKDGSKIWTTIQSNPIVGLDGAFDGVLALVTDISMHRDANEVRARLAAIVESSDDAIVSVGVDGTIATWNRGAENLYQYRAVEVIGHFVSVLFARGSSDQEVISNDLATSGKHTESYDTIHRRKDGSLVEVSVRFSPVRDVTGSVIASAMIAKDLTESRKTEAIHRRTEELFRHAQKMEAVGRLAGGVAHDFNNLLSVILSYSQFAIEDLKPGDPLRDDMIQIDEAGQRAAALTRQLLAFSRQQVLKPRVLDINQVLQPMERMLRRLLGEDVELSLVMDPALGRVVADAGQLEQVVMNLAVNARDAMATGGSLTIETAHVHFDSGEHDGPSGITPGDYVMVAVSDTGTGMDAATCARVFDPFFTTKEQGKGTGLGLSTVFGIVRQSGGYISVSSEIDHGTTFKVYLPMTDRPADAKLADDLPVVLRGSETILLVEDEDQVRTVASTILRRNGYHVLETSNGGEAFLASKSFATEIHLLLTDVVMPRMSGRTLAAELATQRPQMKVLYASGYTDDAIIRHGVLESGVAFIQKPFTPDALLRKVREVLDTSRGIPS